MSPVSEDSIFQGNPMLQAETIIDRVHTEMQEEPLGVKEEESPLKLDALDRSEQNILNIHRLQNEDDGRKTSY